MTTTTLARPFNQTDWYGWAATSWPIDESEGRFQEIPPFIREMPSWLAIGDAYAIQVCWWLGDTGESADWMLNDHGLTPAMVELILNSIPEASSQREFEANLQALGFHRA